jgi:hypothetical protein
MKCPYAKILGVRNEGIHAFRIFDIAFNDVFFTVIGAYLFSRITKYKFVTVLIYLFVIGEILHYMLGVDTKVLELLGLTPKCD